jgi:hypothetical protein
VEWGSTGTAVPSIKYDVEHEWDLGFESNVGLAPVVMGLVFSPNTAQAELSLLETRYLMFQTRAVTIRTDLSDNLPNELKGESHLKLSILPVGLRLPPYRTAWFKPFYFYHWNQGIHELGLEVGPGKESFRRLGWRTAALYDPRENTVAVSMGFSHGNNSGDGSDFFYEYIGNFFDEDEARIGLGGIGFSVGTNEGFGFRGSLLDMQLGFLQTSLLEGSPDYFSWLPVGVVFPPIRDSVSFYYKFHWWPAVRAKDVGMHSYGLGWHLGSRTWVLRTGWSTGVNNKGDPTASFAIEFESALYFIIFGG